MNVEIINKPFFLNLYGFSGIAVNKNYTETAFSLSNKLWQQVRANNLKNKGLNVWVYEDYDTVFAGVELEPALKDNTGLQFKELLLSNYAYYKHVGPYNLIKQAGQMMKEELKKEGFDTMMPYIEIYGHWNNDSSKLETELFMCLK